MCEVDVKVAAGMRHTFDLFSPFPFIFDPCTCLGLIDCFKLSVASVPQFCCPLRALRAHTVVVALEGLVGY